MWVFGYGSLIFRPDFGFAERRVGYVRDWERRFWQGSTDHRGQPGAPGRVVTLIETPGARCWGVAYRVEGEDAQRVLCDLDHREKGGYARHFFDVIVPRTEGIIPNVLTYIGTPRNPNYLGPAPVHTIARQILRSRGPSGANVDYLVALARALREMGVKDSHVFELEAAIRSLRPGARRPRSRYRD